MANANNNSIKLIGDNAIEDASKDLLEFNNYALVLAQSIKDSEGPLTYGIQGGWGKGKTSLMNLIRSDIEEEERRKIEADEDYTRTHFTVWFNPWRYERESHPVVPLCTTIISAIEPYIRKSGQPFDKLKNALIKLIKSITLKPPGIEIEADELFDEAKGPAYEKLSISSQALEALDAVSENLKNQKIVVFVDDLDRCLPEKAVKLLESIKLVLNQPHFIFVFGLDPEPIWTLHGREYTDKLLQVPFDIPDPSRAISTYASALIESSIGPESLRELEPILPVIGKLCENNPRKVKRFLNSLLIDREITLDKDPQSFLLSMAFTRALTQKKEWENLAKALRRNTGKIIEFLRGLYKKEGQIDEQALQEKAKDKNEINAELYEKILDDSSLLELVSSEQFHNLLSRDENIFRQDLLREKKVKLSPEKEEEGPGKRFRPPKRGQITKRGEAYPDMMSYEDLNMRVKGLFGNDHKEIRRRSDQKYFDKIHWNFPDNEKGDVLGIINDPLDDRKYYLMKFDHGKNDIYLFIDEKGVQILDD